MINFNMKNFIKIKNLKILIKNIILIFMKKK